MRLCVFAVNIISFNLIAQSVIKGYAPGFEGKEILLLTCSDYITQAEKIVNSAIIGADGYCKLLSEQNETYRGIFRIDNYYSHLYIEPRTDYEIAFTHRDSVISEPSPKGTYLPLQMVKPRKEELNETIKKFNRQYDIFMEKAYPAFLTKSAKTQVDSFKLVSLKHFSSDIPYLKTYIVYSLASLEMAALRSRPTLYDEYLKGNPVDYFNDAYMVFFNEFYKQYFKSLLSNISAEIATTIKNRKSYSEAMTLLSKDALLSDETLRELVLIKGLYENYHSPQYDKKSIEYVLKTIVNESKNETHRLIALNVLTELTKLKVGSKAPEFELSARDGKPAKLADFKGKHVYIDFWATWCVPCLQEMKLMPELKKKYGKDIEFISISIDDDEKKMQKFLEKHKEYDWTFLHFGKQRDVKNDYNVFSVPAYYLLDTDGIVIQSPAYRPSDKIEETFQTIYKRLHPNKKSYGME